jgi:hypothetical protein
MFGEVAWGPCAGAFGCAGLSLEASWANRLPPLRNKRANQPEKAPQNHQNPPKKPPPQTPKVYFNLVTLLATASAMLFFALFVGGMWWKGMLVF